MATFRGIEQRVRAAGGLMICDEVQSGFGRMGQWWGHEHHGVKADIVTMGKPAGNGHPLGRRRNQSRPDGPFHGSDRLL